jgi:hypothetical protein
MCVSISAEDSEELHRRVTVYRMSRVQWKKIAALKWWERWRKQVHFVDPFANITEDQLDEKVESLIDTMHHRGERSLGGRIRRQDIRDSILRVDPRDPAERQYRRLIRREYAVQGPMHL